MVLFIATVTLILSSCDFEEGNNYDRPDAQTNDKSVASSTKDPLLIDILDLEKRMAADTAFNRTRALRLFKDYQDYYNKHPHDTVAGNYLFQAGDLAQKLGKQERAIELFIGFVEGFTASHRCDEAVYNVAYIYDARLGDKQQAKKYYNKVIELYPQSMWAHEAQGALRILSMSDEELRKFLKEQNQQ
ncbi:MAG: tetratricopeptide repeat protein [Flavobacteriales bacterium]